MDLYIKSFKNQIDEAKLISWLKQFPWMHSPSFSITLLGWLRWIFAWIENIERFYHEQFGAIFSLMGCYALSFTVHEVLGLCVIASNARKIPTLFVRLLSRYSSYCRIVSKRSPPSWFHWNYHFEWLRQACTHKQNTIKIGI